MLLTYLVHCVHHCKVLFLAAILADDQVKVKEATTLVGQPTAFVLRVL